MPEQDPVLKAMASVREDIRRRLDAVIAAILELAWAYRSAQFRWEDYPELEEEVNSILRDFSDEILEELETRVRDTLARIGLAEYDDGAWNYANGEINGENAQYRLDMQGTHLKELLAGWLIAASASKLSSLQTRALVMPYLGNPEASKVWRGAGLGHLGWGKGYAANVLNGMTVISQDLINRAFQYATLEDFKRKGAIGYRTERRSGYFCPLCDELTERIWPLDTMVLPAHPRCVCVAIPVYDQE